MERELRTWNEEWWITIEELIAASQPKSRWSRAPRVGTRKDG